MGILQTAERSSHLDTSENVIFQRHMIAYMETAKIISGNVLEIGCGEGYGITELAPKAEQYFALDKYNTAISEELKEKNNIIFKQMEVPPLKGIDNNSIDFVVTFQVIEHINNDELFISEIYRVGGREEKEEKISSIDLVNIMNHKYVKYAKDFKRVKDIIKEINPINSVLLFIGAGDIDNLAREIIKK